MDETSKLLEKLEWIRIDASNIETHNIYQAVSDIERLITRLVEVIETDIRNRVDLPSNLKKEK